MSHPRMAELVKGEQHDESEIHDQAVYQFWAHSRTANHGKFQVPSSKFHGAGCSSFFGKPVSSKMQL
jgi:hypothetical protein